MKESAPTAEEPTAETSAAKTPAPAERLPRPVALGRSAANVFIWVLALLLVGYGIWYSEFAPRGSFQLSRLNRHRLSAGLEILEVRYEHETAPGGRLVVLYAEPEKVALRLHTNPNKKPLSEIEKDALFVSNAGFFTPKWRPTGLLVSETKVLSPFVPEAGSAGSGILVVEGGRVSLLDRDRVGKRSWKETSLAIQAGPRVIEDNGRPGIRSDSGARANRTVIGRDQSGRLAVAIVLGARGVSSGPTLYELQELLGPRGLGGISETLAFGAALNLDGGPSTGFELRHPEIGLNHPEATPVQNVLSIRVAK